MAKKAKNPAAELAKMRAKSLTPERRSEIASEGGKASSKNLTPQERSARAKKAVAARWAMRETEEDPANKPGKKGD